MKIIDAQIHLWGSGQPSKSHRQVTAFTAAEAVAMMDAAGVDAAINHPPPWDIDGHRVAEQAVRDYPGRFATIGTMSLERADPARVASWRSQPGMLGLRIIAVHDPLLSRLADGSLGWLWTAAEKASVPITLMATHSLPAIGAIAERHPGLRLTIDHLGGLGGNTPLKDAAAMTHFPELLALAKHANVAVKATGLPGYSGESYPFPAMQGFLRQVFDAFGPERTFWGTDITKMPCSWRQCATMFTEELPWLSARDQELVMGKAICAWWSWNRA